MRIDTHRHLGGSIPCQFIWQTIRECGLKDLAECPQDVIAAMSFAPGEQNGFHRFLNKFTILDKIPWDRELIDKSIQAVCNELRREHIDYCWMDFSINKYMNYLDMPKHEVILCIHEMFQKWLPNRVGLILSLKYESPRVSQKKYAELIYDTDVADCLIGIDLVGDEEYFDAEFYATILRPWRDAGMMVRAHVAESQKAENAMDAITRLRVTNIAHGLKLIDHPYMVDEALFHNVCFDLGITSNYITGVWADEHNHPLQRMLELGLPVTIGTDDPIQCRTTLDEEFSMVRHWFDISESQCEQMKTTAFNNTKLYEPNFREL